MSQENSLIQDYLCGQFRINSFQDVLEGVELSREEQEAVDQVKTWLNDDLNVKRNKVMGRRVVEILTADSGFSHLFAFGLGHFLGEPGTQTVIKELSEAGFLVERVRVEDDLRRWHSGGQSGGERPALNIFILCCIVLILSNHIRSV